MYTNICQLCSIHLHIKDIAIFILHYKDKIFTRNCCPAANHEDSCDSIHGIAIECDLDTPLSGEIFF